MNNRLELIDVEVFCCVARQKSFIAASRELGISAAYVTKRISSLEKQLGVTLFNRTTRTVRITDQGELAYQWAQKILDDLESMASDISSTKEAPSGTLRVSTSSRLGRNHVGPVLSILGQQLPKLNIWLELINARVDLITEGIDIDIRVGAVHEPHLIAQRIAKSQRVLCAAPSYLARCGEPRTAAELARHECLLFRDRDQEFGIWRLEGPNGVESVHVSGRVGSNHSEIVRAWGLDGYGIVLLSDWDVVPELQSGELVRLLPRYSQPADIWAITPARPANSAKVRLSIEFLLNQLREGPYALDCITSR